MLKYELEKLVSSLSAAERKNFKLYCNKYAGSKDYLMLFDLLSDNHIREAGTAEETFRNKFPKKSFENTASYLLKVLIDMLIQVRVDQDKWFARHYALMKARLCFERSLPDKGSKELKKAQKIAAETQDHLIFYRASRMELTQIADTGFQGLSEQELVDRQMKAKHTLQTLRQIHEHYSLYELLSYRLTYPTANLNGNANKKLNDLILGELSITTRGSQHQFESKKLHLLFQSFFFIHTGDYRSAMKIFKELNELIELNEPLWDYPPYDYLSALEGILDSLRNIRYYDEMQYFIEKTQNLAARQYPEHFTFKARQTAFLYHLNMLIGRKQYDEALAFFESVKHGVAQKEGITNNKEHLELMFFAALAFFHTGKWQKAIKYIGYALDAGRNHQAHAIYRVCRLLFILIHVELDNMEYLQYEVRTYKRTFRKHGKAFIIERLVFNVVAFNPKRSSTAKKRMMGKKVEPTLNNVFADKHEQQLLKYFDFCEWIKSKYRTSCRSEEPTPGAKYSVHGTSR